MLPKTIHSLQHPFVKYLVKLRKTRSFRKKERKTIIAGRTIVEEIITGSDSPIQLVLIQEGTFFSCTHPTLTVTEEILRKITGTKNPDPIAALVEIPLPHYLSIENFSYLLILDGIADPGNLGTLLRTALALGWEGVYLTENTCDPFNEKALRAAKGATFRIPLLEGSWKEFIHLSHSFQVLVADLHGSTLASILPAPPLALVLSKESEGARKEIPSPFHRVTLPMSGKMESLNVASAGSILLYQLRGELT